jgi:hypothetical protein
MGDHPDHQMHGNSLAAFATLEVTGRKREILDFLLTCTVPLTDRQIAARMGHARDWCQPRVSDMIKDGILEEAGTTECSVSGKRVRLVKVAL